MLKVEDVRRPDGARRGSADFFDLLHAGSRSVALDLSIGEGRVRLRRLVEGADVVLTSARPRAFGPLGVNPDDFLAGGTDRVWAAITAHGWADERVGFGDDVAATGGLVAWGCDGAPRMAADAIADPICGALSAAAVRRAWTAGGRWFIEAEPDGRGAWVLAGQEVLAPHPGRPSGRVAAARSGRG